MENINIGLQPNDGTGDKLRDAIIKINSNFTELLQIVENISPSTPPVTSVNSKTGDVVINKGDISGLENIDNTSDINKPVSAATLTELNNKVPTARVINTTSPLTGGGDLSANRTLAINDAAADNTTKGVATFSADDFNASSGLVSIDYVNGQAANNTTKGFLIAADWNTFNAKAPTNNPTFTGTINGAALTLTGLLITPASATGSAGIRIPHGAAPTTPTNGDFWTTTTTAVLRMNGASRTLAFLDTPTFTGTPAAPTAAGGTTTTQIATTAFVRTPAVQTVASNATVTATAANDLVVITAQAAGLTLANPTGTWLQGQALMYRIKDNGTARTIAFGSNFRALGITLPTTTVVSKTMYIGCIYNSTDTKWDVLSVAIEE